MLVGFLASGVRQNVAPEELSKGFSQIDRPTEITIFLGLEADFSGKWLARVLLALGGHPASLAILIGVRGVA